MLILLLKANCSPIDQMVAAQPFIRSREFESRSGTPSFHNTTNLLPNPSSAVSFNCRKNIPNMIRN